MTKDDIEAVVEVFTPDGTYSAFGDTYQLADFPALVAAAPKGLFLVGPPVLELDGDVGTGQQPLCFVDQTNHDMRIGYYTDTYRRTDTGLAAAHPVDDLPAQERSTGLRTAARPDPARSGGSLMELDEFRTSLDAWLDQNTTVLAPDPGAIGTLDGQMAQLSRVKRLDLRGRLDAVGLAAAGRRAGRIGPVAGLPR